MCLSWKTPFIWNVVFLGYNLWIGAHDHNTEGKFVWVDGSSCCGGIPWVINEPNGGRDENCVNYWDSGHGIGLNDYTCGNKIGFICEYKGQFFVTLKIKKFVVNDFLCKFGYLQVSGKSSNGKTTLRMHQSFNHCRQF